MNVPVVRQLVAAPNVKDRSSELCRATTERMRETYNGSQLRDSLAMADQKFMTR